MMRAYPWELESEVSLQDLDSLKQSNSKPDYLEATFLCNVQKRSCNFRNEQLASNPSTNEADLPGLLSLLDHQSGFLGLRSLLNRIFLVKWKSSNRPAGNLNARPWAVAFRTVFIKAAGIEMFLDLDTMTPLA